MRSCEGNVLHENKLMYIVVREILNLVDGFKIHCTRGYGVYMFIKKDELNLLMDVYSKRRRIKSPNNSPVTEREKSILL